VKHLRSPHVHAGLWVATVAVLMMLPAEALPDFGFPLPLSLNQWVDKIQHLVAFMIMMVLLARSLSELEDIQRPVLLAAISTLAISFFLEALQALVPWRYWDPADLVADTLGVLMAVPIARRYVRLTLSIRVHG